MDVLSYKFVYDGASRIVDNVALDDKNKQLIGFEVRKSGKFSNKVKRYALNKIDGLTRVDPAVRKGKNVRPVIAGG